MEKHTKKNLTVLGQFSFSRKRSEFRGEFPLINRERVHTCVHWGGGSAISFRSERQIVCVILCVIRVRLFVA